MNDTCSPFTPPSEQQVAGVPMYYTHNLQPLAHMQQPQQQQQQHKKNKKPVDYTYLPFPYGVRCAIYSILLVIGILGLAFGAVALCSATNLSIYVTHTYFSASNNWTYHPTGEIRVQALIGSADTEWTPCDASAANVVEAGKLLSASGFDTDVVCVPAPSAAMASGAAAIIVLIFSIVLLVLSSVVLGLLSCHRRRGRKLAAEAAEGVELQQMQQTVAQAAATGAMVYVISERPVMAAAATQMETPASAVAQAEEAAWQESQNAREAKVRRVLAIVCLASSIVGLVFSVIGFATAMAPESGIKKEMEVVRGITNVTAVWNDNPLNGLSCWPHICNLVFYAIAVVLLAVPYLSGITDHPAAGGKRQEERGEAVVAGGHIADEEIQVGGPHYSK